MALPLRFRYIISKLCAGCNANPFSWQFVMVTLTSFATPSVKYKTPGWMGVFSIIRSVKFSGKILRNWSSIFSTFRKLSLLSSGSWFRISLNLKTKSRSSCIRSSSKSECSLKYSRYLSEFCCKCSILRCGKSWIVSPLNVPSSLYLKILRSGWGSELLHSSVSGWHRPQNVGSRHFPDPHNCPGTPSHSSRFPRVVSESHPAKRASFRPLFGRPNRSNSSPCYCSHCNLLPEAAQNRFDSFPTKMSYRALPEWRKPVATILIRWRKTSHRQLPARVTKSAIRQRGRRTASSPPKNASCPSKRVTERPLNYQAHPCPTTSCAKIKLRLVQIAERPSHWKIHTEKPKHLWLHFNMMLPAGHHRPFATLCSQLERYAAFF